MYAWFILRRFTLSDLRNERIKVIAILVATLTTVASAVFSLVGTRDSDFGKLVMERRVDEQTAVSRQQIANIEMKVRELESVLSKVSSTSPTNQRAIDLVEFEKLLSRVGNTEKAVKKLDALFISDAEKAITLPLLKGEVEGIRKEITSIKEQMQSQSAFFKESLEQGRWILGSLGLGVLALIFPIARAWLTPRKGAAEDRGD